MVKSSDTTENDDMMDRSNAEPNKTHERKTVYVIKAIVKRKLLFKTRPKPIIANVTKVS